MPAHDAGAGLDQPKLEELYTRLEGPVFNVVYRWLWDEAEARDVTQEAFLRLWGMRGRVEVATVEPLLYRLALNLAKNRQRSRRLWQLLTLEAALDREAPDSPADEALAAHQKQRAVREAVDALPERLKRVVMLCEFSGMSYAAIAEALGVPSGTVASRRNAALKELEARLGPWEEVPS